MTSQPESDRQANGLSKHAQVQAELLRIVRGMHVGDRLPTERDLAAQFGVSRMTLRQSIGTLVQAGYVSRIQGAGTFVADRKITKGAELTSFSEDMASRGLIASSRLLSLTIQAAGAEQGAVLGLSPAEPVHHIERVRLADRKPMCLERIDIPVSIAPGLTEADLEGSLYDVLRERYGLVPERADQVVAPTVLDEGQAGLLGVPAHSAALIVKRVAYDRKAVAIESATSIYRGDRYDMRMTIRRPGAAPSA